jgi:hypothetical protein
MKVIWNHANGVVFAGIGVRIAPGEVSVPHMVEEAILGPNPLF